MDERFHVVGYGEFHHDDPERDIYQGDMMFYVFDAALQRVHADGLTEDEAEALAVELNLTGPRNSQRERARNAGLHNARLHRGGC